MEFNKNDSFLQDYEVINLLSTDILKDNIREQIQELNVNIGKPINYLKMFNEKYNMLKNQYIENGGMLQKLEENKIEIYQEVVISLEEKFDFYLDLQVGEMINENYFSMVNNMYSFFIINYKEKVIDFFINYIINNKKELTEMFRKKVNKKDLTVSSLRKILDEYDDVIIVSNIEEIVNILMEQMDDGNFILETIINGKKYEYLNYTVNNLFFEGERPMTTVNANFTENFFDPIQDEDVLFSINSIVSNKLINYFNNKIDEDE